MNFWANRVEIAICSIDLTGDGRPWASLSSARSKNSYNKNCFKVTTRYFNDEIVLKSKSKTNLL